MSLEVSPIGLDSVPDEALPGAPASPTTSKTTLFFLSALGAFCGSAASHLLFKKKRPDLPPPLDADAIADAVWKAWENKKQPPQKASFANLPCTEDNKTDIATLLNTYAEASIAALAGKETSEILNNLQKTLQDLHPLKFISELRPHKKHVIAIFNATRPRLKKDWFMSGFGKSHPGLNQKLSAAFKSEAAMSLLEGFAAHMEKDFRQVDQLFRSCLQKNNSEKSDFEPFVRFCLDIPKPTGWFD